MSFQVDYRYTTNKGEWHKYTTVSGGNEESKQKAIQIARNDCPLGTEEVRVIRIEEVWMGYPSS